MAERKQTKASDEIELGQLFEIFRRAFMSIFNISLRFFIHIKRNIYILIGLGVLGIAAGYGLKQISVNQIKTEVIVGPNLESKEYLYDVVDEIQANIWAGNESFFSKIDIDVDDLKGVRILVEPLGNKGSKLENELKYLELLRGLDLSGSISDLVRNEILERNSLNHKVTFIYSNIEKGEEFSQKIMSYINSNPYFNSLVDVYNENAQDRIERDMFLISQIDTLIGKYSMNLSKKETNSFEGPIVLDAEKQLDIAALIEHKKNLIRDIEKKKIELQKQTTAIRIINFGKPQQVKKPFFGKKLVLMPLLFVGGFFLFSIIRFLNKEASKIE